MKNNKILYILTLIITLFTFNTNVYATVCVYKSDITVNGEKYQHEIKIEYSYTGTGATYTALKTKDPENGDSYINEGTTSGTDKKYILTNNIARGTLLSMLEKEEPCLGSIYVSRKKYEESNKQVIETNVYKDSGDGRIEYKKDGDNSYVIPELTCVYGENLDVKGKKIVVVQTMDGKRTAYINSSKIIGFMSPGWGVKPDGVNIDDVAKKNKVKFENINQDVLISCPKYAYDGFGVLDPTKNEIKLLDTSYTQIGELALNEKLSSNKAETVFLSVVPPVNTTNLENKTLLQIEDPTRVASCQYWRKIDNNEMHYIQMIYEKQKNDVDEEEIMLRFSEYDPEKTVQGRNYSAYPHVYIDDVYYSYNFYFSVNESFNLDSLLKEWEGNCPSVLIIRRKKTINSGRENTDIEIETELVYHASAHYDKGNNEEEYTLMVNEQSGIIGTNQITGEKLNEDKFENIKIEFLTPKINNCTDLLGEKGAGLLNTAWNIVKFGVPIALLGLGTVDFAQAVFANKDDGMKKAQEKFIKRIIIAVAIFLTPTLITFLLNIANNIWGGIGTDLCGVIF